MNEASRAVACELYFLPVRTRVPLKFGGETLTSVTCARVKLTIEDDRGRRAVGWGETPLSVQWVWPSAVSYDLRHEALKRLCIDLTARWAGFDERGHAMEIGAAFIERELPVALDAASFGLDEPIPHLAGLVCCSAFDLALHDAFARLLGCTPFEALSPEAGCPDLRHFFGDDEGFDEGVAATDFISTVRPNRLPVWHLVGGLDPLAPDDLVGNEPDDGHPVLLRDWIRRDGLKCLKIKLRGTDAPWDYNRIVRVGRIAVEENAHWLSTDFNCTVTDPAYVTDLLDRLKDEHPRLYGMVLYVEQPFPYDLEANPIDAFAISARKPLFLDESAHDWRYVRMGRSLGWNGVALKTCKTFTGAVLSACWARQHGMTLMVQDLTNPMLAMVPHVQLAAHIGTIMGVESNAMQCYPDASAPEMKVHPGLYQRRGGVLDLSTLRGPGFGYRIDDIQRELPAPAAKA